MDLFAGVAADEHVFVPAFGAGLAAVKGHRAPLPEKLPERLRVPLGGGGGLGAHGRVPFFEEPHSVLPNRVANRLPFLRRGVHEAPSVCEVVHNALVEVGAGFLGALLALAPADERDFHRPRRHKVGELVPVDD